MRTSTKITAAIGGAALTVATAGAAYAYWTTSGSGTGSAATGTSAAVTVTQTSSPSALRPGGAAQLLTFSINNPQSTNQSVSAVTVAIANAGGSAWSAQADTTKPACTADDFAVVQPTWTRQDLAPGTTAFNSTGASISLLNGAGNQDNCKNVTVPLQYTAS